MTAEPTFFEQAYQQAYRPEPGHTGRAPWNIGRAQPPVVALAEEGTFIGTVLDIGCGLGDNAIHLASRGLTVTGSTAPLRPTRTDSTPSSPAASTTASAPTTGCLHRGADARGKAGRAAAPSQLHRGDAFLAWHLIAQLI